MLLLFHVLAPYSLLLHAHSITPFTKLWLCAIHIFHMPGITMTTATATTTMIIIISMVMALQSMIGEKSTQLLLMFNVIWLCSYLHATPFSVFCCLFSFAHKMCMYFVKNKTLLRPIIKLWLTCNFNYYINHHNCNTNGTVFYFQHILLLICISRRLCTRRIFAIFFA